MTQAAIQHILTQSVPLTPTPMHLPKITPLTAAELLSLKIPPREHVIAPILGAKGLMMVHAARGTGKTFFVLSLAYAIAAGAEFLGWQAPQPRRVLIVDGEMAMEDLRDRLRGITLGSGVDIPADSDFLTIIAADHHENGLPDLSTKEGQGALWPHFEQADVIVFDNLSTLFRRLRENENDDLEIANSLFLELRRQGKSVIIVHHSGKNGAQRGGSRREDILNTVIGLRRPSEFDAESGCVFDVVFEKARGFYGDDAKSCRAQLVTNTDGAMHWERRELVDELAEQVRELSASGKTQRVIATELNIGLGSVNRILNKPRKAE